MKHLIILSLLLALSLHAQTQADLERQVQAEQWADAAKSVDALLAATPDDATLKNYKAEISKHLNTSDTRIPDDQIKKLAALVQADKLDEARKVAFTFTLLYPDDARSKEWQARLDAMSGKASPAAAPSAPAPADDDAIKKQVDRELRVIKLAYADAQKLKNEKGEATEPYYEALDKILARPDPFTNTAAVEISYYATRAQLALEAGDPWVGITAATKLTSLGADKLNNDAYADLFAKLDSRGWLVKDSKAYFERISSKYKAVSVNPNEYYQARSWKTYNLEGWIEIPRTETKSKMTGQVQFTRNFPDGEPVRITYEFNSWCRFFDDGVHTIIINKEGDYHYEKFDLTISLVAGKATLNLGFATVAMQQVLPE